MKIFIASDHAGSKVKGYALDYLLKEGLDVKDLSPINAQGDDYPDFAKKVSSKIQKGDVLGVLVCGTGIGMSIAANKYKGIRAALCLSPESASLARKHNDANILVLSGKTKKEDTNKIVHSFFRSKFEGERHELRLAKIKRIESNQNI